MRRTWGWTAAAITMATLAWTAGAEAKTFEVTRTNDPSPGNCRPNDCSLREAVLAANDRNGADRIVLPSSKKTYRLQIENTDTTLGEDAALEGDLDVLDDRLAIRHPGKGKATINANDVDRVFAVSPGSGLTLDRLVLTGGDVRDMNSDSGGAIFAGANLTITRSTLARNVSDGVGGAIDMDAAGDLRIVRSTLKGNESAESTSGAIRSGDGSITIQRSRLIGNRAVSDGGAIRLSGAERVRIAKSTIAGNRSGDSGGGIQNDGEQPLRITDSTISGNFAEGGGGGIQIGTDEVETTIVNSTIAGNRALGFGGGVYTTGDAVVTLNAVTIARNVAAAEDAGKPASTGGGIHHASGNSIEVRNSIVALNEVGSGGAGNDCSFEIVPPLSLGSNLLSTDGPVGICEGFNGPGDLFRSNPKIGRLAKNGGPTKTIELKKGSTAIGNAHRPSAPNRDQRGRKRDNQPDIGAFERGA